MYDIMKRKLRAGESCYRFARYDRKLTSSTTTTAQFIPFLTGNERLKGSHSMACRWRLTTSREIISTRKKSNTARKLK
ncbi:MAG: hypothetical protein IJQ85_02405 [Selenomonadaceae bacterium]|nr:hypothetical protein [Selenomonadaceae bacterium]